MIAPAERFKCFVVQSCLNGLHKAAEQLSSSDDTSQQVIVISLGKQLNYEGNRGVDSRWVLDALQKPFSDGRVKLNQRTSQESIQQFMEGVLIARSSLEQLSSDFVVWEVAEIVVICEDFDGIGEVGSGERQGFEEELIDSGAADDGEVAKVVVVGLIEQWLFLCPFCQLYQPQQMMFCELSPSLIVYVYPPDAVTIEIRCPIFYLLPCCGFHLCAGVLCLGEGKIDSWGCYQ